MSRDNSQRKKQYQNITNEDEFLSKPPDVDPMNPSGYDKPDFELVKILVKKGYLTTVEGFHLVHGYYLLGIIQVIFSRYK